MNARRHRNIFRCAPALLTGVAVLILFPIPLGAHQNVEATIAHLTEQISSDGASARLHYHRAIEYRILGKPREAAADLQEALRLQPAFSPAQREMARLQGEHRDFTRALGIATEAVENSHSDREKAASLTVLSRLHQQAGQLEAALAACEQAIRLSPSAPVDLYLLHGELLGALGRHLESATALMAGHLATGSVVLRDAWIDALLDAGEPAGIEPIVEKELEAVRLKSAWLLRRARARLLAGMRAEADADLRACLLELSERIHPGRPDALLIADRGLATALLGDTETARADLMRVESFAPGDWATARLRRELVRASGPAPDDTGH